MSTALAITTNPRVTAAVVPPPRKSEIIEAMARRKHGELTREAEKNLTEYNSLQKELEAKAREVARESGTVDDSYVSLDRTYHGPNEGDIVGISLLLSTNKIPADLQRLNRRMRASAKKLMPRAVPSIHEIRRQIRDAMANHTPQHERVTKLLADPAASRAIDKALAALDRPDNATSAPVVTPSV